MLEAQTEGARKAGAKARNKGLMRVSPFYGVRIIVDGKRVDVTAKLDQAWFAGYDGVEVPEKVCA
jgi:hypothetical protein